MHVKHFSVENDVRQLSFLIYIIFLARNNFGKIIGRTICAETILSKLCFNLFLVNVLGEKILPHKSRDNENST